MNLGQIFASAIAEAKATDHLWLLGKAEGSLKDFIKVFELFDVSLVDWSAFWSGLHAEKWEVKAKISRQEPF